MSNELTASNSGKVGARIIIGRIFIPIIFACFPLLSAFGASPSESVDSSNVLPSGHTDPNKNFGNPSGLWIDDAPSFRIKGWSTEMSYQAFVDYAVSQGGRVVQSVAPGTELDSKFLPVETHTSPSMATLWSCTGKVF